MASIRSLKKDIDFLLSEVASDCYFMIYFHPERKDKVSKIISEALEIRNELFAKVNVKVDKKEVKKYFKSVRAELMGGADALFNQLSEACEEK